MKYILVCGCSRSGNTLMAYLCATGFHRVLKSPGERNPLKVTADDSQYDWVVGKRPKLVTEMITLLKEHENVRVIYMLRDPRAVLVSRHPKFKKRYYTAPMRWIKSVQILDDAYLENNKRFLVVKYEDLIANPSNIQTLISQLFDMKIKCNFDECYKQFAMLDRTSLATMHGARAMDTNRITSWKKSKQDTEYVDKMLKRYPVIVQLMSKYGY